MKMKDKIEALDKQVQLLESQLSERQDEVKQLEEDIESLEEDVNDLQVTVWEEYTTANGNTVKVVVDNPVDELLIKDFFECLQLCTPAQMEHNLSVIKQFKTVL